MHAAVVWRCLAVREAPPADVPSLGEAERELAEALRDATAVLTRLDVAASGPAADAAREAYRARSEVGREVLAPGYPPRAVRVLELARRIGLLVDLAYDHGHGGAVSASEMTARGRRCGRWSGWPGGRRSPRTTRTWRRGSGSGGSEGGGGACGKGNPPASGGIVRGPGVRRQVSR